MVVLRAAVAAVLLALAACSVGEVPIPGGTPDAGTGGSDPQATFNAKVRPLVTRCLNCHGPAQPPNLTSYAMLDARYKTKPSSANILITKGDHQGTMYFSQPDKTTVAMWIDSL